MLMLECVGRGSHLPDVVRAIPLDRLLIETDGPFILPRTLPRAAAQAAKRRCESMHLPWVLARVAEIRGVALDSADFGALAAQLHRNSVEFFGLADKGEGEADKGEGETQP